VAYECKSNRYLHEGSAHHTIHLQVIVAWLLQFCGFLSGTLRLGNP